MSATVKQFVWRFQVEDVHSDVERVCAEIASAMPNIEVFIFQGRCIRPLQERIAWLCKHMVHLRRIVLPLYGLSFPVLRSLLSLETLKEVVFDKEWSHCEPNTLPAPAEEDWPFSFADIPYTTSTIPSLNVLSMGFPMLQTFIQILRWGPAMFSNITRLTVRIAYPTLEEGILGRQVREVGTLLAIHAGRLEDITLYLASRDGPAVIDGVASPKGVTFNDIQPFLHLPFLHSFGIHLDQVLCLDDSDIRSLASSMPHARSVVLNPHPTILSPSLITWRSLTWFAVYCPKIMELGLYVNGTAEVEWPSRPCLPPSFRRLRLGRTDLPTSEDNAGQQLVASCLGDILSPSTEVKCLCLEDILDVDVAIPDRDYEAPQPFWRSWCHEMGKNWSEIALLMRAVMEERLLSSEDRMRLDSDGSSCDEVIE